MMKSIGKRRIGSIMRLRIASEPRKKWLKWRKRLREKIKLFKKSKNKFRKRYFL